MQFAFIFPGQGSQSPGMGREMAATYPAAQAVFDEADDALGFKLSALCFEGSSEALQLTENTQPAILATSIATLRALQAEGVGEPVAVAGHSLGEYSALVAAGALGLADAIRTVRLRGRYMQEAVPVGVGAMAAVMGAELGMIAEACEEARADAGSDMVCSPANINSPNQIVIAGHAAAIDRALEILKERGAKRAIKLNVSAPFHSALMKAAQERLAAYLFDVAFNDLRVPLVTNVDAEQITSGAAARDALIRQVTAPVRWSESIERLTSDSINTFVEVGPGKVLAGLMRQNSRESRCLTTEDAATVAATAATLAEQITSN
jgi:[acyl-carrier-protein] S-malonyltransferase